MAKQSNTLCSSHCNLKREEIKIILIIIIIDLISNITALFNFLIAGLITLLNLMRCLCQG
jgi:hypothetical protein